MIYVALGTQLLLPVIKQNEMIYACEHHHDQQADYSPTDVRWSDRRTGEGEVANYRDAAFLVQRIDATRRNEDGIVVHWSDVGDRVRPIVHEFDAGRVKAAHEHARRFLTETPADDEREQAFESTLLARDLGTPDSSAFYAAVRFISVDANRHRVDALRKADFDTAERLLQLDMLPTIRVLARRLVCSLEGTWIET